MDLTDLTRVLPRAPLSGAGADPDATRVIAPRQLDMHADAERTVLRGAAPRPPIPAPLALAPGTRLHEYRIDGVLGQGGFGITYLATDVHLKAEVAIKEYLPQDIVYRSRDGGVSPTASRFVERYRQGLESFLAEARTLAALRHPAIVRVARFFEAQRTAYMVLEYERGTPLKAWWPRHSSIGEAGLVELLLPLLDGLAAVHAAGFLHRDIKPDNLQVRDDGSLVLLDFGNAGQVCRLAATAEADAVIVTPGYAPIEQYGIGEQGPWTDLYALAATLYWAATGQRPPDAEERARQPAAFLPAIDAVRVAGFGSAFLKALDWALQPDAAQRPRDVASFRRALCADHVNSLRLQEALQQGDSEFEDDRADEPRSGAHQRGLHAPRRRSLRMALRPADWPLAVKLTLLLVATALLPMLLTGLWNLHGGTTALARAELENVEQLARGAAGRVGQFIDDARHMARGLASDAAFATFLARPDVAAIPALQQRLRGLVRADPDLQLVILMDREGQALVSNDPEVMGRSFAFRRYFREAAAGRGYTSGIVVGAVAGATGFFVSEPIVAADGTQVGVLVLRVLGSSVTRIIDELKQDAALTPFLVDGDGVVLHHPDRARVFKSLAPLSAEQQAEIKADQRFRRERVESLDEAALAQALLGARAPGHRSVRSASGGDEAIVGFAPVPGHDWMVAVRESRESFEAPMRELFQHLLWSMLLVGAVFTALALRVARGIVLPIRGLTASAHALKAGDFDRARVAVTGRDELGQLGRTFNVMIEVLRSRERERRIPR